MKPKNFALLALSALVAVTCLQAHAVGRVADITIVDRDSGATLPVHYHRGDYWVAGKPGARYAVAVRNKIGERVMAVMAIDGVNILNGETAGWDQTGYVFSSYERSQITGWRKSSREVAAFEFSDAGESYAGRTGRLGNVGVIGIALFREKAPEAVAQAVPLQPWRHEAYPDAESRAGTGAPPAVSPAPAQGRMASPSARADMPAEAPAPSSRDRNSEGNGNEASDKSLATAAPYPTPKLGTAHGQREVSVIGTTSFTRAQPQPNEIIRIRYDSRENLIASGVIREPVALQPLQNAPDAFPQSANARYVPDPPARRY